MVSILKNFRSLIANGEKILTNEALKMAIIVRTDISMGKGKIGSQCAHAAIECYRKGLSSDEYRGIIKIWEITGQPKIVLKISSQSELLDLANRAKKLGVITATIKDAGRTQLPPGTISVLGIGPGPKKKIESLTSDLKLL